MPNSQSQAKSEFNEAIGFLSRVNTLLYHAHYYRTNMQLVPYCNTLISLHLELGEDIPADEREEIMTKLLTLKKKTGGLKPKFIRGSQVHNTEAFDKLVQAEQKLRKVWDDAGYKTRRAEDPFHALGR